MVSNVTADAGRVAAARQQSAPEIVRRDL